MFLFRCVASASYGTWVGGATSSATLSNLKKEREFVCYLRFRYSLYPSISFTNWNPFSMSSIASFLLFVALHVYSSSSSRFSSCV